MGTLYLTDIWQALYLRMGTCYDPIEMSAQNKDAILGSIGDTIERHIRERRILTLTTYNFLQPTLILTLEATIFIIHTC